MTARMRQPGLLRGGWMFLVGAAFAIGLLAVIRLAYGEGDLVPGEGATTCGCPRRGA